jgi:Dynamitin
VQGLIAVFATSIRFRLQGLTVSNNNKGPTMSDMKPHTMTDPADEAGGEVIFSSDGLAPIDVTKPPVLLGSSSATKNSSIGDKLQPDGGTDGSSGEDGSKEGGDGDHDSAVLDSSSINVMDAFEVFKGKMYSVKTMSTTAAAKPVGKETPLQRLARLQGEITELEAELSATTSTESGREFDEQVVQLATELKARLKTAESASSRLPQQDELTRMIRQQLKQQQQLQQQMGSSTATATEPPLSSSNAGVVFELYGTARNPTTTVEERVTKVERIVGQSTVSTKSLLARLEDVETIMARVDPITLEQSANKAKVIRADLEAASKARNKLTATYKKEDSKTIQELHQQMTELEGLSLYLPALTQRLQQMANLHVQAANFATRLTETERQASQVQATMAALEATLEKVRVQMVENLSTVEQNMQTLDARLNKL